MEDSKDSKKMLYAIIAIIIVLILIIGVVIFTNNNSQENDNIDSTNSVSEPDILTRMPDANIEAQEVGI